MKLGKLLFFLCLPAAIIDFNGMPIEFVETNLSDEELASKEGITSPD